MPIREIFLNLVEAFGPFSTAPHVAVAVSGGADSLCLAFLLQEWVQEKGGQLHAVIVDHQLRLESTTEAQTTAVLLEKNGIPSVILSWEGPKPTTGLQRKAREARYRLLIAWCHQQSIRDLFLAHHADDQLETVLIRESRESRPRGLAGMSACVEQEGIRLLRPLLPLSRIHLQAILQEKKIPWIEDPSNQDLRFTRIQVRRQCAAFSEAKKQKYLDQIQAYGLLRQNEDLKVSHLLTQTCTLFPEGYAFLDLYLFEKAPLPFQRLALRKLLHSIRGKEKFLKEQQIDSLLQALCKNPLSQGRTLNGCFLKKFNDGDEGNVRSKLLICREEGTIQEEIILTSQHPFVFLWDNRFLITLKAPPLKPLTLKALGEKGLSFLKKNRSYPQSTPRLVLLSLPSLWEEDTLVEIPHLNLRLFPQNSSFQEKSKIDRITQKVLFIGETMVNFALYLS